MYSIPSNNVGIGTTSPDEKLTVDGNVHITGDLIVDGSYSNESVCTYWPTYPNAVFWRGDGTANKAIVARTNYDSSTGKNFYQIEKADGTGAQTYHMVVIWKPPLDYEYSMNDSAKFVINFETTGTASITSVEVNRTNGSSVTLMGSASIGSTSATLTGFTGLIDGEWVPIDIAMSVDDGGEIKLYQIQIEYNR